jgi:hypothetical protein
VGVSKEVLALGITVAVHIVGVTALVWALMIDKEDRPDWRGWLRLDDGDDPPGAPEPPMRPRGPGGALPLPDAAQSDVRLREPGRLADERPPPPRRPEHPPVPVPVHEHEREHEHERR